MHKSHELDLPRAGTLAGVFSSSPAQARTHSCVVHEYHCVPRFEIKGVFKASDAKLQLEWMAIVLIQVVVNKRPTLWSLTAEIVHERRTKVPLKRS